MGDVSTLNILKNAFLSPLGKTKASPIVSELPFGHASSAVSLHDNHNIEIKTISELCSTRSVVETDLYLFVPKNFELAAVGKDALISDFRSRVRLALPISEEQGSAALEEALTDLANEIKALHINENESLSDVNHALCEPLLEAAKDLSSVIAENLKHRTSEHTRKFLLSHSLMTIPQSAISGLDELSTNVSNTAKILSSVRAIFALSHSNAVNSILGLLDEYLSQLYVQYLGTIRSELDHMPTPKSTENNITYSKKRTKLERTLTNLQTQEAKHRLKFGIQAPEQESDLERETRLVRLSQLKKFFQSTTFVDVTRQQSAKKISESTATIGTAAAAIIAASIEQFGRGHASADVAWQGLSLLSLGVIVYVLRDRLKDWAKKKFHQKALKFLPDFEQKLIARDKRIGRVKEWFQLLSNKNVPLDILSLRRTAALTEMEKRLPEDVFHCRKIQEVDSSALAESNRLTHTRALFESTRVNFDRYLKHMDDAFKDFTDLDARGRFLSGKSHRVYYFYLCIKTTSGPAEPSGLNKLGRQRRQPRVARKTETLLYRVVLDKNGVVRIENIAS